MLDLFCGRFGWSRAFAAKGWTCTCVDLVRPAEIPANRFFHQMDILQLTDLVEFCEPDFICASSPCEQFSCFGMKHFHPKPAYPALGVKLFDITQALCEASGAPYIMENVRAAQLFVGDAVSHCGPFYLWGNAVPPILPQGITKAKWKANALHGRNAPGNFAPEWRLDKAARKGKMATIPAELANCVADYAERLLERR